MSRWNNWPDYIPFDPSNPQRDLQLKQEWYAQYKPLLEEYAASALAALRNAGFNVTVEVSPETHYYAVSTGWSYGGWAEQNGFRTAWSIGPMTPRDYTPDEWAQQVAQNWQFELLTTVRFNPSSEQVTNPALANQTVNALDTAWQTGPGPSATVQTPVTVQPAQSPAVPDSGTLPDSGSGSFVLPPSEPHTFDEWNYIHKQRTGRDGPSPEAVGFPAERRQEPIIWEEWTSYTDPWFATAGGSGSGTGSGDSGGSGGSGGPGAPAAEVFSLIGALVALLTGAFR
jgi:hypothetical protein